MRNEPWSSARDLPFRSREPTETTRVTVPLEAARVVAFDNLLHEINPDAPRADLDRVQRLANWLATLPDDEAQAVIDMRMEHADALRRMLAHPEWPVAAGLRARGERLLDYLARDDGLIAHGRPFAAHLDDALLIELCWPQFAEAVEEFLDFESDIETGRAQSAAPTDLLAWQADRRAEAALWRHQLEASFVHYAPEVRMPGRFTVD